MFFDHINYDKVKARETVLSVYVRKFDTLSLFIILNENGYFNMQILTVVEGLVADYNSKNSYFVKAG